jgi:hypothetical protein
MTNSPLVVGHQTCDTSTYKATSSYRLLKNIACEKKKKNNFTIEQKHNREHVSTLSRMLFQRTHHLDPHSLIMGFVLLGPHLLHPHTSNVAIGPRGNCETLCVDEPILRYPSIQTTVNFSDVHGDRLISWEQKLLDL